MGGVILEECYQHKEFSMKVSIVAAALVGLIGLGSVPTATAMSTVQPAHTFGHAEQLRQVHYCNGTAETTITYDDNGVAVGSSWTAVGVDCV